MTQADSLTRRLALMADDARGRSFGATEPRMEAWIRHGYLLALEEIERSLDDRVQPKTMSGPRDAA